MLWCSLYVRGIIIFRWFRNFCPSFFQHHSHSIEVNGQKVSTVPWGVSPRPLVVSNLLPVLSSRLPTCAELPCHEENHLLGGNAVQSGRSSPTFQTSILPASSWSKDKPSKKWASRQQYYYCTLKMEAVWVTVRTSTSCYGSVPFKFYVWNPSLHICSVSSDYQITNSLHSRFYSSLLFLKSLSSANIKKKVKLSL
jgi:hypothetical protein